MDSKRARRRLAAILSTDAVGFSRRMAEDDVSTVETMRSHRETIHGLVREHHGRVVDAVGDNLLAEFASAVDSVACAIAAQRVLAERNGKLPENRRLPFRIGLHLGDLLVDEDQLYGDGVNIAARLEALAESGGICASGAIVEQVRGKVECGFVDLGDRELKNIPVPVRVWRVQATTGSGGTTTLTVPGFGGRPAIAVLPFENRSSDAAQEFLADGIVEDVIARLSAFRLFPVIARSSTFTYNRKQIDARQVSRELGARYVVEGSVRQAGNRVRVAVQLVDGTSGHQVQAERYDREIGDVFELQDEIVETLVGWIEPALANAEQRRARAKPTANLDAWEALHRGNSHFWLLTQPDLEEAVTLFRRASALDPTFAQAYAMGSLTIWEQLYQGWVDDAEARLAECIDLADRAIRLAAEDPLCHVALGWALSLKDGTQPAIRAFERAVELNPSFSWGWWGLSTMLSAERPDEALSLTQKALRLSPLDVASPLVMHVCALCCFNAGRYDEAAQWETRSIEQGGRVAPQIYRVLGAALGHLGKLDEARAAIQRAARLAPDVTLEQLRARNSPRLMDRLLEGWKKAGWSPPE